MSTEPRHLDIKEIGDITIATFLDSKILDETIIQSVGRELFALVDEDGPKKIVLDSSLVEDVSSTVLGKLITLKKKLEATNGKLRFCCVRPEVSEVFEIARCYRIFGVKPTLQEALDDFQVDRIDQDGGPDS